MLAKMLMMEKLNDFIMRLKGKEEVEGILIHGGVTNNSRHEADFSSDLDITIFVSSPLPGWMPNFKFFVPFDGKEMEFLEVDVYQFVLENQLNSNVIWDPACREGYAYSTEIIYDKSGQLAKLLEKKCSMTPEYRAKNLIRLLTESQRLSTENEEIMDKNMSLSKAIGKLVEAVFWLNWEYPPDLKWRVSGMSVLEWTPNNFLGKLQKAYKTPSTLEKDYTTRQSIFTDIFQTVLNRAAEENILTANVEPCLSSTNPLDAETRRLKIARLFTRIDKYSGHSAAKCIRRGFPWNAHDIINEGIRNFVDILYYINGQIPPFDSRITRLATLEWLPKQLNQQLYRCLQIMNYEDSADAKKRADILRELFLAVKQKIQEEELFDTVSLYDEDFIEQDLFGKASPYMLVFKCGDYTNRQIVPETFYKW